MCPVCVGVVLVDDENHKLGKCIGICKSTFKNLPDPKIETPAKDEKNGGAYVRT